MFLLNHIKWKLRRGREGEWNTWQKFNYQVKGLRLRPTSLFMAEQLQGKCFSSTPVSVQMHSPLTFINFNRLLNTWFRQRHQLVNDLFNWGSEIYPECLQSFLWSTHKIMVLDIFLILPFQYFLLIHLLPCPFYGYRLSYQQPKTTTQTLLAGALWDAGVETLDILQTGTELLKRGLK